MCGIAGIIKNNTITQIDKKKLSFMLKAIKHRGPDSSGTYIKNNIAIGMNRLAIIDINNGNQPIKDKNNIIIFNGEIYNFENLKKKYFSKEKFKTNTDTEVLLKGYNKFGINFFKKCNGIFTFCIIDHNKNKVIIGRDPIGVKPLYLYIEENSIFFSSELKSFYKFKNIKLDKNSLSQYLSSFYSFSPNCALKKVISLNPGTILSIKKNLKIKKNNFFDVKNLIFVKNKENKFDLKKEIINSVKRQLVSDVPVGLLLSSGLDSMSILSSLKSLGKLENTNTYTSIYDDKSLSEEKFILKLSKEWGFKPNLFKISSKDIVKNFDDYIKCYDDFEFMRNSFAMYHLCKNIKKNKVLLSGVGGDEIFLGYKTHIASNLKSYFKHEHFLFKILHNLKSLNLYNDNVERFFYGSSKSYKEAIFLWRRIHTDKEINKNFLNIKDLDYSKIFFNYYKYFKISSKLNNFSKKKFYSYIDMKTWLVDHGLKLWDKAGMYSSKEIRVPFLDLLFLKKIFKTYEYNRCKKIGHKINLMNAFSDDLPKYIINNPKKGFSVPIINWLKNKELQNLFIHIIYQDKILLTESYKRHLKFKILNLDNYQNAFKIWNIVCLCRWTQVNKFKF